MIGSNLTKCNIGKSNKFCGEGRVIRIYNYGISATERTCVPKGPGKTVKTLHDIARVRL